MDTTAPLHEAPADASPRSFVQRSTLRGLAALFRDFGIMALAIAAAILADSVWVSILAVLVVGTFQFAVGEALLHEASHHNLVADRKWNDRLQVLYAWPFFWSLDRYRKEHLLHHRRLGKPDDHLTVDYTHAGLFDPSASIPWIWWGRPLLGLTTVDRFMEAFGTLQRGLDAPVARFWGVLLIAAGLLGWLDELLLYWWLPYFSVSGIWLYWSELTDHVATDTGTRSNLGRLTNWLFHNNGLHRTHHRWPSIPWHQLPAARSVLLAEDADTDVVYTIFEAERLVRRRYARGHITDPLAPYAEPA